MTAISQVADYDRTQRVLTLDEFRATLKVSQEKTGQGDKQVEVWYIRDRDDPKGERGSQVTVTAKDAVEWQIRRSYRSYVQRLHNLGRLTHAQAESQGAGKIDNREAEAGWAPNWYVLPPAPESAP